MSEIFEYYLTVDHDDADMLQHVNNVVYVGWLQDSALAHSADVGWTTERHLQFGFGWVVRWHHINYLRPCFANDRIIVRTWVSSMKRVMSERRYQIFRVVEEGKELVATAETRWGFIKYSTGSPARIPTEIQDALIVVDRELDCLPENDSIDSNRVA